MANADSTTFARPEIGPAVTTLLKTPLADDSETLRQYCVALTLLLLQRQQPAEQEEHITGMLFELMNVLVEDLKTPRFVRTSTGLAMISGGENPEIH
ncbi:hypothetical protein [Dryocola sp. BD586]|uniref:hypothetical protein n=1 Tax=Dryocola sp. BD586 TaxID=3133271 RepID=UPI003F4F5A93